MKVYVFLTFVFALMMAGAIVTAGIPGLVLCLVALGAALGIEYLKQRRKQAREARAEKHFEELQAAARTWTEPLPTSDKSMLDVLREDPEYRLPEDESPTIRVPVIRADAVPPEEPEEPGRGESPAKGDRALVFPLLTLGSWPQGPNGEREPIQWLAIRQEPERTLALSLYILELRPFHDEAEPIRWKHTDLRRWLVDDFFDAAFTPEEQAQICQPEPVENSGDDMLWQLFGLETVTASIDDRVFALSASDLGEFFPGENSMFHPGCTAQPTPWVEAQGDGEPGDHSWWLRSSMQGMAMAYIASPADSMGVSAIGPNNRNGVRPAIWIRKDPGGAA